MTFIGTCENAYIAKIARNCHKRLNKRKFNQKLRKEYPELYENLALQYYNPYNYYQNSKYYVMIHSDIDYVFEKDSLDNL